MTISTKYIGLDVHRDTISIAVADDRGDREIRFFGTLPNKGETLHKALTSIGKDGAALKIKLRHHSKAGQEQALVGFTHLGGGSAPTNLDPMITFRSDVARSVPMPTRDIPELQGRFPQAVFLSRFEVMSVIFLP